MRNLIDKIFFATPETVGALVTAAYAELGNVEGLRDFRKQDDGGDITVVMTQNPEVIELIEDLQNADIPWRTYSGRGMYGSHTIGVSCGRDVTEGDVYRATKAEFQIDQLGKGTILYLR
ncbi:hypothetical protein RYA05_03550 [Pseudomonas syringae pv. actinidiae]|nr:hypothetical protein [Pseudomonas syringae pv. actinidiae]